MNGIKKHWKLIAGGTVAAMAWGYYRIKKARAAAGTAVAFDFGEFASGVLSQPGTLLKAAFATDAQLAAAAGAATTPTGDTSEAW